MSMKKCFVLTLGCPKNEIDSESMSSLLVKKGFILTDDPAEADLAVVNTCAFIDPAKEESIEAAFSLAALKTKGNLEKLIVCGCLSQRYGERLLAEINGIDAVIGTGSWSEIGDVIDDLEKNPKGIVRVKDPGGSYGGALRDEKNGRVSSYLKVSEGCDNECSYCMIPSLRGPFRSRPIDEILQEAGKLAENGVKEISIISNDTGSYGTDLYGEPALPDLMSGLEGIEGFEWIRLLYLHPSTVTEELLDMVASSRKVCRYLDMPIQHVSSRILRKMKRRMDADELMSRLEAVRKRLPGAAIRTSLIAGFPGESGEEFEELLSFVERFRFEHLGVFSYSREEGTEASLLPGQVRDEVKLERVNRLMEVQMMISSEINESYNGTEVRVLIEQENGDCFLGRMSSQAPEVDGAVRVRKTISMKPGFADVRITGTEAYDLEGEFRCIEGT
ncbi:MAG: 30S ribosomal protein S12 methylthiotransferase RimO [Candidatus Eisenbacteria bacterium]|nr:30S ribosomal protein S12 methylthiotransferase RimO [Candidatus Eisenbacteria bacterium]